jgi:ubiquinone/menaquinone biosynthesis C-methylase UbiE
MKTEAKSGRGGDAIYALGHSEEERRRLSEQDAFVGDLTGRLLLHAGVGPGMRVLDVGCGVGDVSLRAASLVGSGGEVVGVDKDPLVLADAEERVRALGLSNVKFVEGDLRDLQFDGQFDAAVGRFILMYLADPAAALRHVAGHVRPGGVLAFQEYNMAEGAISHPRAALWERTFDLIMETLRRAGTQMEMGLKMYLALVEAGLPAPEMRAERIVGGGPEYSGYGYVAEVVRSLLPMAEKLGVVSAEEVGIETLHERIRDEVVALGAAVALPSMAGAWTRKTAP